MLFAKWFKIVLALPLLPTDRITSMWNELKSDPIPNAEHIPRIPNKAMRVLKKYVEKTWVVGKLDVLSVYGQPSRTNNNSEVYNKKWYNLEYMRSLCLPVERRKWILPH